MSENAQNVTPMRRKRYNNQSRNNRNRGGKNQQRSGSNYRSHNSQDNFGTVPVRKAIQMRDKYLEMAKNTDDRIDTEYWLQHADHYNRIVIFHNQQKAQHPSENQNSQEESSQNQTEDNNQEQQEQTAQKPRPKRVPRKPAQDKMSDKSTEEDGAYPVPFAPSSQPSFIDDKEPTASKTEKASPEENNE